MKYLPGPADALAEELRIVQDWTLSPTVPFVILETLNAAPSRPVVGQVVRADGTNWNPGSGEGLYAYTSGATWAFLG